MTLVSINILETANFERNNVKNYFLIKSIHTVVSRNKSKNIRVNNHSSEQVLVNYH